MGDEIDDDSCMCDLEEEEREEEEDVCKKDEKDKEEEDEEEEEEEKDESCLCDEGEEEEEEYPEEVEQWRKFFKKKTEKCRVEKPCTPAICRLSIPNRRRFLCLWKNWRHVFSKQRLEHLKDMLKRLYAMTPEETALYFAEIRAKRRAAEEKRRLKRKLCKLMLKKKQKRQRERAYKLFLKILKCGLTYAVHNRVPPLLSIRLRYLSDAILEQLCELSSLELPDRLDPDEHGRFMIAVADWMAIAVERLFYVAQLIIKDLAELDHKSITEKDKEPEEPEEPAEPCPCYRDTKEGAAELGYEEPKAKVGDVPEELCPIPYYSIVDKIIPTFLPDGSPSKHGFYTFKQKAVPLGPIKSKKDRELEIPLYSFVEPVPCNVKTGKKKTGDLGTLCHPIDQPIPSKPKEKKKKNYHEDCIPKPINQKKKKVRHDECLDITY